jgi:hypothetical protein
MKQIYGFIADGDDDWEDVFVDEENSPEYKISSACHIYHDVFGRKIIGFDLSLNIPLDEMKSLLEPHSQNLLVRKGV